MAITGFVFQEDELGSGLLKKQEVKIIAATSYTVLASDLSKLLVFTAATTVTLNVPNGLRDGHNFFIEQKGAGVVDWSGSAATINNAEGHTTTSKQYAMVSFVADAADVYNATGLTA